MSTSRLSEELTHILARLLPADAKLLKADFERNAKAAVKAALERMDLVSREEFEVQVELVERMQTRITELETALEKLESQTFNND